MMAVAEADEWLSTIFYLSTLPSAFRVKESLAAYERRLMEAFK